MPTPRLATEVRDLFIRLRGDQHRFLAHIAAREGRSMAEYVRRLIDADMVRDEGMPDDYRELLEQRRRVVNVPRRRRGGVVKTPSQADTG